MVDAPTSVPRPLQLASGSIITPQDFSSSPNPNSTDTEQTKGEASHQTPSSYTPPHSARAMTRPSSRRHSSISYIHSATSSPSFRRESVDVFMKSPPLSETHPIIPSQFPPVVQLRSPVSLLSRNKSFSGPVPRNVKDKRASHRTSNGSFAGDSEVVDDLNLLKERPPITLAEKHADLLQFIAQKESKCLELRSQLVIHEAELLQLKRKWELIVNRGFEKSPSSATPSPPFLSPSATSVSHTTGLQTPASPYFPVLPGAHAHAPVLEGIKEGVQGMSRLIAAGFESIAGVPIEPPHAGVSSLHQPPLPLLLRSTSKKLDRKTTKRHGQNESQSSSSTVTSTSSQSTAATNTTTATSIRSSLSFDSHASIAVSQTINKSERDVEGPRGSLEHCDERSKNSSPPMSDSSEQVLMVRDTGATPTMSPNPDFERKRRSKKLNESQRGNLSGSPVKKNIKNEEDFDPWLDHYDGWDELSSIPQREQSKPAVITPSRSTTMAQSLSKSPSSLPPMSVPGLATMNLAGPAAQQVSSWMGTVSKRLGEIKGNSTFTKSQKRASVLLSDMQNTFVSSLISPSTPASYYTPSSSAGPGPNQKYPVLDPIFSSNPSVSQIQPTSASLLDEFEDSEMMGSVLVPSVRESSDVLGSEKKRDRRRRPSLEMGSKPGSESDDDWNW